MDFERCQDLRLRADAGMRPERSALRRMPVVLPLPQDPIREDERFQGAHSRQKRKNKGSDNKNNQL